MLIDLKTEFPTTDYISADVCVCGSGPAGITIARTIAKSGISVALIEAGSLEYSETSQEVYGGENIGLPYWGIDGCRLRYFGGTSNHWSGMCGLLDAADFKQRNLFEIGGWPISYEETYKYLSEAMEILDLPPDAFTKTSRSDWRSSKFHVRSVAYSPPTRFAEKYLDEIKNSQNIKLILNANANFVKKKTNEKIIDSLIIKANFEKNVELRAKHYVLAMGALENCRFLLNNVEKLEIIREQRTNYIGRCFMEHLGIDIGRFVSTNNDFWFPKAAGQRLQVMPTEGFMEEKNLGNGVLSLHPNNKPRSYGRTRALKQAARELVCNFESTTSLARYFADLDCPGDGVIGSLLEQLPNPNSRVLLGSDVDRLGLRKIEVDWRIKKEDFRTIRSLAISLAQEVARLNLARVQLKDYILDRSNNHFEIGSHCHQMGTTRMAVAPDFGVVNSDCKVFGVDNLYVGGSSVFPTGGGTNPTLTIVSLAIRLGEHISTRISG